ncbi:hypothetical protein NPX13_g6408 [Xylaria arbuscula]|uniref:Uncharacterized protein n=1 Tax=Xylaria arbuscula TaxID=114810 RepID=A0A9W8TLS8_9PEZI|nr:hypothetical protein NPX13_g6408 [Xylaria arbuscula]
MYPSYYSPQPRPRLNSVSSATSYGSYGSSFSCNSAASTSTEATVMSIPGVDNTFVAPRGGLPCEFVGYGRCDVTFALDDVANWIEHIVSVHLRDKFPKKALCWFCDDIEFDYKSVGDRRINFEQRMWHIRDHIIEEGRRAHEIRPDYHLNKHLYENRLIGEEEYNLVRRYSEIWQPSYLVDRNATTRDWETPESDRSQLVRTSNRDEERSTRRQKHKKNKESSRR